MRPQFDKIVVIVKALVPSLRDPLEHLPDIPQVVDVVGFIRGRPQPWADLDLRVEIDRRFNELGFEAFYQVLDLRVVHEIPVKDVLEDPLQ